MIYLTKLTENFGFLVKNRINSVISVSSVRLTEKKKHNWAETIENPICVNKLGLTWRNKTGLFYYLLFLTYTYTHVYLFLCRDNEHKLIRWRRRRRLDDYWWQISTSSVKMTMNTTAADDETRVCASSDEMKDTRVCDFVSSAESDWGSIELGLISD